MAKRYDTVIAVTDKDVISDGYRVAKVNNGTALLGKVTGTGCMTGALIGSACGANRDYFTAATTAVAMGNCWRKSCTAFFTWKWKWYYESRNT